MKNNVVRKNDYELYLMNIPLTLLGKKRKQYIRRELEKVHPCFGEQYSFDSRRCIRKGKIQTLIAVMDKVKVLEYKKNRKSGLHLEGINAGEMFAGNYKLHAFSLLVVLILCVFLAGALGKKNQSSESNNKMIESDYNYITEAEPVLNSYPACHEILEECFEKIKLNKGEIKSLSIGIGSNEENAFLTMDMYLENMYPESLVLENNSQEINEVNFSHVNYDKDVPSFECNLDAQVSVEKLNPISVDRISELRNMLGTLCSIKEEDFPNAGFHFELPETKFTEMFEKISSMDDVALKEISISRAKNDYDVSMVFTNVLNQSGKGIAKALLDYSSLFVKPQKTTEFKPVKSKPKNNVIADVDSKKGWEKIGRVVQKNGKTLVYYRDDKNQIRGVEE